MIKTKHVLLMFLPIIVGGPFVGRAFFVDDQYHMTMAQGLLEHPTRPYDFVVDDAGPNNRGWEQGQPPRMVNPPGHHYILAVLWTLGGERLWVVRLGMLFLAAGCVFFLIRLSQQFYVPPWPSVLWILLTPVFLLSFHTLMIDGTMFFFFNNFKI